MTERAWWQRVSDFVKGSSTVDRVFVWLGPDQKAPAPAPIDFAKNYVGLRVKSARIPQLRQFTKRYHLSVSNWIDWRHEIKGMQHATSVLAPADLRDIDPKVGDKIGFIDTPVLRYVPCNGQIRIRTGLFAVIEGDIASPLLDYLVSFTEKAGLGIAGPAKIYAELLDQASDILFGKVGSSELVVAMDRGFEAKDLKSGLLLISDANKSQFDLKDLRLDADGRLITQDGNPYTKAAYVILEVQVIDHRPDWLDMGDLRTSWVAVETAFGDQTISREQVNQLLDRFSRQCKASPDLLSHDAQYVVAFARAKFDLASVPSSKSLAQDSKALASRTLPSFDELDPKRQAALH